MTTKRLSYPRCAWANCRHSRAAHEMVLIEATRDFIVHCKTCCARRPVPAHHEHEFEWPRSRSE
jgi:hypothetical protein